jgi:hypothetical protein
MSVIAPIVAPLALYTDNFAQFINHYFSTDISATGLPWLYFSLLSLGIGQFAYNGFAPAEIKDYTSRADYAANGGADLRQEDWLEQASVLVNEILSRENTIFTALNSIGELPETEGAAEIMRTNAFLNRLREDRKISSEQTGIFREAIHHRGGILKQNGLTDGNRKALMEILMLPREQVGGRTLADVERDRKQLCARWYDIRNISKPIRRYIIVSLYAVGLSFFIWNIPRNIIENIVRLWL